MYGNTLVAPQVTTGKSSYGRINSSQRFGSITLDLDRALHGPGVGFGEYEHFLLEQVREESWTRARVARKDDPEPCEIVIRALGRKLGDDPKAKRLKATRQLTKAKTNLIASRVLIKDAQGRLLINKDAEAWIFPDTGRPRLSEHLRRFCREAQPVVQATLPGCDDRDEERPAPAVSRDVPPAPRKTSPRRPVGHPPAVSRDVPPAPHRAPSPIGERGRGDLIQTPEENTRGVGVAPDGDRGGPRAIVEPPVAVVSGHRPPQVPEGAYEAAPLTKAQREELQRLSVLALDHMPNAFAISRAIADRRGNYRADCYGPALETVRACERDRQNLPYFLGIVRRLDEAGGPAAKARPAPAVEYFKAGPVDPEYYLPTAERMARIAARRAAGTEPTPASWKEAGRATAAV